MKPKINRLGDEKKVSGYDQCNTPPYALAPLLPYLLKNVPIWECASGKGYLVAALRGNGYSVYDSDLDHEKQYKRLNFLTHDPVPYPTQIVTNPPYSIKYKWIDRCYHLWLSGFIVSFSLLIPLESIGAAKLQKWMRQYPYTIMLLDKRVNFEMPNKGFSGNGAQFPVIWYTVGLDIKESIVIKHIERKGIEEGI